MKIFSKIPLAATLGRKTILVSYIVLCIILGIYYLIVLIRIVLAIPTVELYQFIIPLHTYIHNNITASHGDMRMHWHSRNGRYCDRKHIPIIQNTCPRTRIICLSLFLRIGVLKPCVYRKPPCGVGVALNGHYWHGKRSRMHNGYSKRAMHTRCTYYVVLCVYLWCVSIISLLWIKTENISFKRGLYVYKDSSVRYTLSHGKRNISRKHCTGDFSKNDDFKIHRTR